MARPLSLVTVVLMVVLLINHSSPVLSSVPQTCRSTFDAVARIRGEIFFFKHDHFWRLSRHGYLMTRDPVEVGTFWEGLPDRSDISAAYQRPDGSVVFFCGRHFWVFWERRAKPGYPRPLSDLGLPEELGSVDAAFVSGHNQVTYLLTGDKYWRFNELSGKVESDSPQAISRLCRGLPNRIDAAFTDNRGRTFFLQERHYWRCDLSQGRVQSYAPDLVAPRWLDCSLTECCLDSFDDQVEVEAWPRTHSDRLSEEEKASGEGNGAAGGLGVTTATAAAVAAAAVAVAVMGCVVGKCQRRGLNKKRVARHGSGGCASHAAEECCVEMTSSVMAAEPRWE